MEDSISISEDELNLIIKDMNSESMEISKCLEGITKLFDSLSDSLEGEIADSIKAKFNSIEENFPVIKSNLEEYISDFNSLISKFNTEQSSVSMGEVNLAKGGETVNVKK
jgi:archaellum component FlaC